MGLFSNKSSKNFKRIFLVVLDSVGCGEADDADKFNDVGAHTLKHVIEANKENSYKNLSKLGLFNLVYDYNLPTMSYYTKANEISNGKDTLTGHLEMMGINTVKPFKTFTETGFPKELINELERLSGRKIIGNCNASGTEIIKDLGEMQMKTGALIVYTSADSVLQIAAHEDIIPVEELYKICEQVRELTKGDDYKIARIIARPYIGKPGSFTRTPKRHDYALDPPINVLDLLDRNQIATIAIGKISDIFNNKSIATSIKTKDNIDGMMKLIDFAKGDFKGLLFANLNDFDMLYGHRRDRKGYLNALEEFNYYLPIFLKNLKKDDLFILTADHGNDPTFKGTDHTRENIPVILYNPLFKTGMRLKDRDTFADIGATILDNFEIKNELGIGTSIFDDLRKK